MLKILVPISFLITPLILFFLPAIKDYTTAFVEVSAQACLLIQLMLFSLKSKKNQKLEWSTIAIFISIFCVFFADTLNSARLIKLTTNYGLLSDCLYSGFAFFLLIFLVVKLNIFERKLTEWGWIFLGAFIIDATLSYCFLLEPYYLTTAPLAWKVSGGIYMVLTIFIFALILPFAFRVSDRSTFWFLNLLILLLTSDFAIRYQDAFVNTATFSWAETAWCSTFIGLAWLMHFSKRKKDLFVAEPLLLAPYISIRSLLTLSICFANNLLLVCILSVKLYLFQNAIDISIVLLLLFLFWTIANEFSIWLANDLSHAIKYMFKSKENLAADGMIQFNLEQVTTKNPIFEISKILESYNGLAEQTNRMMSVVVETNKKATMAEVAFQVSHDIRSPLAALDMAVKSLPELPEETRILIRSSIGRIKDITNNLLLKNPKVSPTTISQINSAADSERKTVQLISSLIDRIISEKRMQFRAKIGIEIDSMLDENAYGIFSEVNTREFMRLLSNLINNAVESIENNGRVTVSLVQSENYAVISIVDNGHGIPSKILNSLGRRGKTFGKKDGSGLGLYHARKTVESWNGHLKIHSEPRGGTTVSVMLPLAKAAPWFVEHLRVPTHSTIAILDDDVSIHQIWNGRFEKANAKISNVEILHFSTPDQLAIWTKNNKKILATTLFLVDYEFLGFNKVGLEVIEDLEIQSQSILVTSHYEEIDLRKNCERLGVQLIPKEMAAFIPITIESEKKVDAILIDDDTLVHLCWKQGAKEKHKSLASFSTEDEFMRVSSMFAKNTPIYVDVSLANGVRGELVAMRISKIGFSNVYLATGYEPDGFLNLPFIKGVIDKNPPF